MNWILHPMLVYLLLAATLLVCSALFLTLKSELRAEARRRRLDIERIEKLQTEMRLIVAELEDYRRKAPEPLDPLPQPSSLRGGMNLSRRAQILRMSRRGERPDQISAALGVPLSEVELLLKVHQAGGMLATQA